MEAMGKLYLMFTKVLNSYGCITKKNNDPWSGLLYIFYLSVYPIHDWIITEREDDLVTLRIHFPGDDSGDFDNEESKLKLSYVNYQSVAKQWDEVIEKPSKYLVLSQDESGWITLERKEELSKQDLDFLESEKQEQLKYEKSRSCNS